MSTIPFSENKLRFGKYKDKPIKDVPDDYLRWILDNKPDIFKGKMLVYLKTKLGYTKIIRATRQRGLTLINLKSIL